MSRRWKVLCLAICLSAAANCSSDGADSPGSPLGPSRTSALDIGSIAASASVNGVEGTRRTGSAPPPSAGPSVVVSGNARVINGGTQSVTVTAGTPFERIFLFVGGRTLGLVGEAPGGIAGYYELRLPVAQTSAVVLLNIPQEIPIAQFDLQFAAAAAAGVGPYAVLPTSVTSVGTGDVQVTLAWDADSDVDLHVVGPGAEEVFYGRRAVPSGGQLDLDSNAGCNIDGVRNENITWPVGRAPRGVYTVRVDYWSSCGVAETNYTVRINNGGAVQIFSGRLTGSGDQGGAGSGRTIATFERLTGPGSVIAPQALAPPAAGGTLKSDVRSLGTSR